VECACVEESTHNTRKRDQARMHACTHTHLGLDGIRYDATEQYLGEIIFNSDANRLQLHS